MKIRHNILVLAALSSLLALLTVGRSDNWDLTTDRQEAKLQADDSVRLAVAPLVAVSRPVPVALKSTAVTYRGHAVDGQGRPVPDAAVRWSHADGPWLAADSTAADGSFVVTVPGQHTDVEVLAPDGRRVREDLFDEDDRIVRLRLHDAESLEGTVRRADGQRAVDVRVSIWSWNFGRVETRTRADGSFRLAGVPRRLAFSLRVNAGAAGHLRLEDLVWAPDVSLELQLPPVRTVRGRLVTSDADGVMTGVAGVRVLSRYRIGGTTGGISWSGRSTDAEAVSLADGTFALEGLTKTDGDLTVHSERFESVGDVAWKATVREVVLVVVREKSRSARTPSNGSDTANTEAPPGDEPSRSEQLVERVVRVVDEQGEPVSSATLTWWPNAPGHDMPVGPDARTRLSLPESTKFHINVEAPGHVPRRFVRTDMPQEGEWLLALTRASVIEGRVLDARGHPVRSAFLRFASARYSSRGDGILTDLDGRFRIEVLPNCAYRLEVASWRLRGRYLPWEGIACDAKDVVFRPAISTFVAGRLADPQGVGIADIPVLVKSADSKNVGKGEATTDVDGYFRVDEIIGRSFFVQVHKDERALEAQGLDVRVVRDVLPGTDRLVVRADRTLSIKGVVRWPDGRPAADADLWASPAGHEAPSRSAYTDAHGRFEITGLLPGTWRVKAVGYVDETEEAYGEAKRAQVLAGVGNVSLTLQVVAEEE